MRMVNSIKALSGKVRQYAPTIVLSMALLLPAVTISSFTIPFAYLMLPVCGLYILYWTKSNFSVLFRSS
ncbi:MAG: hypothetical protein QM270_01640, partial [Bacillota bacterium]|nr:hypothetical protein [Bacillota bacterium]